MDYKKKYLKYKYKYLELKRQLGGKCENTDKDKYTKSCLKKDKQKEVRFTKLSEIKTKDKKPQKLFSDEYIFKGANDLTNEQINIMIKLRNTYKDVYSYFGARDLVTVDLNTDKLEILINYMRSINEYLLRFDIINPFSQKIKVFDNEKIKVLKSIKTHWGYDKEILDFIEPLKAKQIELLNLMIQNHPYNNSNNRDYYINSKIIRELYTKFEKIDDDKKLQIIIDLKIKFPKMDNEYAIKAVIELTDSQRQIMIDVNNICTDDEYAFKATKELNDSQRQIMIKLIQQNNFNNEYAFAAAKELNDSQRTIMFDLINKNKIEYKYAFGAAKELSDSQRQIMIKLIENKIEDEYAYIIAGIDKITNTDIDNMIKLKNANIYSDTFGMIDEQAGQHQRYIKSGILKIINNKYVIDQKLLLSEINQKLLLLSEKFK
jgi:hypothetical protein